MISFASELIGKTDAQKLNGKKSIKKSLIIVAMSALLFSFQESNAQMNSYEDKILVKDLPLKKRTLKMTTLAFGGTGVLFTKVNNQLGVMIGGRGSATFNNRFTFGGGGWGMLKGIEIESSKADTFEFFKFGYGGLEFGYLFYEGEKFSFGSNLLFACGASFVETYPKTKGTINLFPVFEPSIYSQFNLGKLSKLDIGIKYRLITGSELSYISNRQMSGPSVYFAFLVGTCNCN